MKYYFIKVKKKTFDPIEILSDQSEKCFIKVKKKTFDQNEIDPNEIGIYLNETEFYTLLIILVANLIYDYVKDDSEILFSTN